MDLITKFSMEEMFGRGKRTRAYRRFEMKKARKRSLWFFSTGIIDFGWPVDYKRVVTHAITPKTCSCELCGNVRRNRLDHFGITASRLGQKEVREKEELRRFLAYGE